MNIQLLSSFQCISSGCAASTYQRRTCLHVWRFTITAVYTLRAGSRISLSASAATSARGMRTMHRRRRASDFNEINSEQQRRLAVSPVANATMHIRSKID